MGIIASLLLHIAVYVKAFKNDFTDETVNKLGNTAMYALVAIAVLTVISLVIGGKNGY